MLDAFLSLRDHAVSTQPLHSRFNSGILTRVLEVACVSCTAASPAHRRCESTFVTHHGRTARLPQQLSNRNSGRVQREVALRTKGGALVAKWV